MSKSMYNFVSNCTTAFQTLINNANNLSLVLDAYNSYCNEEQYGEGYIYNLDNKYDVMILLQGGMATETLVKLYHEHKCRYIRILNENEYEVMNVENVILTINSIAFNIMESIILFPYIEPYKKIYLQVINFMREK